MSLKRGNTILLISEWSDKSVCPIHRVMNLWNIIQIIFLNLKIKS